MTFRHQLTLNYFSQIYMALIGLLILPLFLKYLGAEAYGLIGFFTMMQTWFWVLDLGFTQAMSRETARYFAGASTKEDFAKFLKSLEILFTILGLVGCALFLTFSHFIAKSWLKFEILSVGDVQFSLIAMGLAMTLRWFSGLYRNFLTGAEKFGALAVFNMISSTCRFVGALAIIVFVDPTVKAFFIFQIWTSIFEVLFLYLFVRRDIRTQGVSASLSAIRPVLKFSSAAALTSTLWIVETQTDKLMLSQLLPLGDYGYYTLAVLVAGAVLVLTSPIASLLTPRLSALHAAGSFDEINRLYGNAAQIVSVVVFPMTFMIIVFAKPLLWAWTGDEIAAVSSYRTLQLYVLGNGLLALGAFPYYLQFAMGELKYHIWGTFFFIFTLIPLMIFGALKNGAEGAGLAWAVTNISYLVFWVPFVHSKIFKKRHWLWVSKNIAPMLIVSGALSYCVSFAEVEQGSRLKVFLICIGAGIIVLALTAMTSTLIRQTIFTRKLKH